MSLSSLLAVSDCLVEGGSRLISINWGSLKEHWRQRHQILFFVEIHFMALSRSAYDVLPETASCHFEVNGNVVQPLG